MPAFLEKKLRKQYGDNPSAIYGTMNKLGAMRGSKITAKGRAMERGHALHASVTGNGKSSGTKAAGKETLSKKKRKLSKALREK